jgi:restriction system protein
MAVWLIRAGSHGEYELKFIQENRVYVTWDNLGVDLAKLRERAELTEVMAKLYPDTKPKAIANWVSQVWPFAHEIKKSDVVVLPLKTQPAIQIALPVGATDLTANQLTIVRSGQMAQEHDLKLLERNRLDNNFIGATF